jgi:prevent-host-death family protein
MILYVITWNIALGKQQFSEVVRQSAQEPQAIYKRDKPVAVLINADDFEAFRQCHAGQREPTLAAQMVDPRLTSHRADSRSDHRDPQRARL